MFVVVLMFFINLSRRQDLNSTIHILSRFMLLWKLEGWLVNPLDGGIFLAVLRFRDKRLRVGVSGCSARSPSTLRPSDTYQSFQDLL